MASSKFRITAARAVFALSMVAMVAIPATVANAQAVPAIKHGGNLVVDPSPVQQWVDAFNPAFSGGNVYGERGLIYESLIQFNGETGKATPWLATKWGWAHHAKTLWFTIRKGVKWNDGKPFSAADVLYSGRLTLAQPAFDGSSGMDPYVKSVTRYGNTVSFNLKTVNSTLLYYIGQNLLILPQHIWSKVSSPVTFTNPNPVGTGPFMLKSFSPQQYVLKANKRYWQKGKPYLSTLTFPAYSSNTSAEADIINGKTQWSGILIPDAAHTYVPKAKGNHFWFNPANQPACLYTNDGEQPFSNVWVRRAISEVVNRNKVWKQGEYGYETPSNAGFIQTQFRKTWGDSKVLKMLNPNGNVKAAKADLAKAMKNPATAAAIKNKTFQIVVVAGWTDWDASVAIIASELNAIGIHAVENQTDFNTYNSDLNNGTFDMGMSWTYGGLPNPYPIYKFGFGGAFYVPDGKNSNGNNRERYRNPKLDKLINAFGTTVKQSQQVAVMKKMEGIVAKDVPIVPLVTQAYWYEYNTAKVTGFPTKSNPYEIGSPYQPYEEETVALNLHLK
jgi:peptide/nickel transport system substrate-binding protein